MYNQPYQGPNSQWGNQQTPQGFSSGQNTWNGGYEQPIPYSNTVPRQNQPAQWGNQQPNQWGGVYPSQGQQSYGQPNQGNYGQPGQGNYGQPYGQNQPFNQTAGTNQFYGNQMPGYNTGQQYGTNPYGNYSANYGNNRRRGPQWGEMQMSQYGKQNMAASLFNKPPLATQQETQLKMFIDELFMRYDMDRSGTLDCRELTPVFNEILMRFNIPITLSQEESRALLYQIDVNTDGRINKTELFNCIKNLVINETTKPNAMY